jgi:hypothetical protein
MTGSNSSRDDGPSTGSGAKVGGQDPCRKTRRGPINSPKAAVLAPLSVGSVLSVDVVLSGSTPVLVVKTAGGAVAGSLTFVGYLEIIDCITTRGFKYEATIVNISGGVHEVRVEPL